MTEVAQTTEYNIYSDIAGGPVAYYMKLPTDLFELLSSNVGNLKITINKNNATFVTSDASYGFSILPEDENQPHECYIEEGDSWNKVAHIKNKMLTHQKTLNDQHIENLKQSLVEADPKSKHKIRRLESKEALNVAKRASTRDSNKLSNPLKKNQKLLQLKDKLPSLASATPVARPPPKVVPIPITPTRPMTAPTPTTTPPPAPIVPKKDLSPPTTASSNNNNTSGSTISSNSSTPSSSDLELRKNIIHWLGPGPLGWNQLQDKFSSIGEKDLASAVNKVATMKPSQLGPLYHLKKQLLSEIDLDWSNYNDEDRKKIRELKSQNNKPPSSSIKSNTTTPNKPTSTSSTNTTPTTTPQSKKSATTGPAVSTTPTPTPTPTPAPVATVTPTPTPTVSAPKASSSVKSEENNNNSSGSGSVVSNNNSSSMDIDSKPIVSDEVLSVPTDDNKLLVSVPNPAKKLKRDRAVPSTSTSTKEEESSTKKVKHSDKTEAASTSSSKSSSNGSSSSSKITHEDQLQHKKHEFDKKYSEYLDLRNKIESIQKQFVDLGNKLKLEADKTPIYEQINQLYKSTSQSAQSMKERHSRLHKELKELKHQVKDYLQRKQQV